MNSWAFCYVFNCDIIWLDIWLWAGILCSWLPYPLWFWLTKWLPMPKDCWDGFGLSILGLTLEVWLSSAMEKRWSHFFQCYSPMLMPEGLLESLIGVKASWTGYSCMLVLMNLISDAFPPKVRFLLVRFKILSCLDFQTSEMLSESKCLPMFYTVRCFSTVWNAAPFVVCIVFIAYCMFSCAVDRGSIVFFRLQKALFCLLNSTPETGATLDSFFNKASLKGSL